jgi:hypothetical protein
MNEGRRDLKKRRSPAKRQRRGSTRGSSNLGSPTWWKLASQQKSAPSPKALQGRDLLQH